MDVFYKRISIAILILLFLAVAGGFGEDGEVRHFDAQSAFDSASDSELEFINDIKLRTNSNWNTLTDAPNDDYNTLKDEISYDLDLIVSSGFQIDDTPMTPMIESCGPPAYGSANTPVKSYEGLYADGLISVVPTVGSGLELDRPIGPPRLLEFSSGFEVGSEIFAIKDDIDSKLDQIAAL